MIVVNDVRPGQTIVYEGNLLLVMDTLYNKSARRQMIVKLKVKNLRTGTILELSFTGGDRVEPAFIEKKAMQFLYKDEDLVHFIDLETYEQIALPRERLQWELQFMKENDQVTLSVYGNETLGVILADKVSLRVTESQPTVKGDTAVNPSKMVKLETGIEIKVPMFVEQDDLIWVSTEDGKYHSRVKE